MHSICMQHQVFGVHLGNQSLAPPCLSPFSLAFMAFNVLTMYFRGGTGRMPPGQRIRYKKAFLAAAIVGILTAGGAAVA
jgi:hypothetical protein